MGKRGYRRCPICRHKLKETRYREEYWEVEYWYECKNCGYKDGWYYGNYETVLPCENGFYGYGNEDYITTRKEIKRKIREIKEATNGH